MFALLEDLRDARAALERVVLWRYAPDVVALIAEAALEEIDYHLAEFEDDDDDDDLDFETDDFGNE